MTRTKFKLRTGTDYKRSDKRRAQTNNRNASRRDKRQQREVSR
jgi:hypothetical protein